MADLCGLIFGLGGTFVLTLLSMLSFFFAAILHPQRLWL